MKKFFSPDQPEQPAQSAEQETREDYIAKLQKFIEERAEAYRADGISVADNGRVDPNPPNEAERWGKKLLEGAAKGEKETISPTEQMEMLSFAIFTKNLQQGEFVVARSSQQDNLKNSASILILERKTGNLVCAFSEVADFDNDKYRERTTTKAGFVNKLNLQGGASLDHGIIKNEEGDIVISGVKDIPVFYLALPPHHLYEGLKHFKSGMEQSSQEKNLYGFFIASIYAQIKFLSVEMSPLNEDFEKRIQAFRKIIKSEIEREDLSHIKKFIK